jgi:uncharacterized protein with PIN domain
MLGQDVRYSTGSNDEQLIGAAKAELRTLLTRDLKLFQLAQKRGVDVFLVEGATVIERLASLGKRFRFRLEIDMIISRCPKCNAPIKSVAKTRIVDRVPKATSTHYSEFWECSGCGQTYWQGSHWKRIKKTLNEAGQTQKGKAATRKSTQDS